MSDSSYAAVTRHRKPYSTAGRSPVLDVVDDVWAADKLSDDEIDSDRQEAALAPLLEDGDLDVVVVSSSGGAIERRRREEGRWNDLALDHFDTTHNFPRNNNNTNNSNTNNNNNNSHHVQDTNNGQ